MFLKACRTGNPAFSYLKQYRYAHRGLHDISHGIPENSIPAFARAIEHGFGAELDVHLTADRQLVVVHDSVLKRLCDSEGVVEDMTVEELQKLPLLGTENRIPLFEDVLRLFEDRTPLIVEVKTRNRNHAEVTEMTCKMLDRFRVRYCVESFDPFAVTWLRRNRPEICRGQLSENFVRSNGVKNPILRSMATNLQFGILNRPDFIAYRFEDRDNPAVKECRERWHVEEVSWTIRSEENLRLAEKLGNIPIFENFIPEQK